MPPLPAADRPALDDAWATLAGGGPDAGRTAVEALPATLAATPEGLRLAARAAWSRGLPEAALVLLADALDQAPDDPATLVDLAVLQMEAGQRALAEQLLHAALDLSPDLPEAHAALAGLAEDAGDPAAALRHLRAACTAAQAGG